MQGATPRLQMRQNRWSRRRLFGAAASAGTAVWLAACSSNRGQGAKGTSATGQAGTPKSGGTLNLSATTDFFSFDASVSGKSVPNPNATTLAYEGLLAFQQGSDAPYDKNTAIPSLAQRWEVPDSQTYIFHLQPNVTFANLPPVNGRPLTAADVVWSFAYHSRTSQFKDSKLPPANFAYMFEGLDRIETPDAATVTVRFGQPFAPFLAYNYTNALPIMPHEIYDQNGDFSKHIVGSGPFQLDAAASQQGSRWVFKKNPNYRQQGKPYLDEIHYLVIQDDATTYAAFQTGQIDILHAVNDLSVYPTIKKNNPQAVVQEALNPQPRGLQIGQRQPPFTDLRLRRALSLALDRDEFDRQFSGGKSGWVMSDCLPDLWTQAEIKQILKYDPQQAKQLLSDAGYPNGLEAPLMLEQGEPQAPVELLQAQYKKVGVNVIVQPIDRANGSKRVLVGDFVLDPTSEQILADLDSRVYGKYFSTSTHNEIGIKDSNLDQLLLAQRREVDPAKRRERLRDVTRYMNEQALSLALYLQPVGTFWTPALKNYADNWQQYDWNAANIWLDR